MNILVAGGTGFIGPHFVRSLVAAGHDVTLFNRGNRRDLFPELTLINGDRTEGDLSGLAGTSWDAVVDTAAYIPRVVEDLLDAVRTRHYLFISSISVYADTGRPGLTEADAVSELPEPIDEFKLELYGPLKAACEAAARTRLGDAVTIVRPGLIVGPGDPTDRFTWWPVRFSRGGRLLCPGDGADPLQVIDVRDLAGFVTRLVGNATSGTFNATGPVPPITVQDLVSACMDVAGPEADPVWIDWDTLREHEVSEWSDLPAVVSPAGEAAGFGAVDVSRAVAAGLTFRPIADTVGDTLEWWKAERNDDLKAGLKPDREAAVLAAAR